MIEIIAQQPIYVILVAAIATVLTGITKTAFSFVKKVEITYFLPFVFGEAGMFVYCLIAKIGIKSNLDQILMNGVYAGLLSGVMYQLYKQVKDVGLKAVLGGGKAVKIYSELKEKIGSSLNAMTYARRLANIDGDDLASMVDVLRGSGIDELNLYGVANSVSTIIKAYDASKKKTAPKEAEEQTESAGDGQHN